MTKSYTIEDIEKAINELNEGNKFECTARQLLLKLKSNVKKQTPKTKKGK